MDEGATVDSDHSMTWEDVYGSTTDLTSTLIGIYDSFLQPTQQNQTDCKDNVTHTSTDAIRREHQNIASKHARERARLPGIAEVAGENSRNSVPTGEVVSNVGDDTATSDAIHKTNDAISSVSDIQHGAKNTSFTSSTHTSVTSSFKYDKSINLSSKSNPKLVRSDSYMKPVNDNPQSGFENLSPNVKRMVNSASGKSNVFLPRKTTSTLGRNSGRSPKISNIPLIGTTSKLTLSAVNISPTAEIYDQPKANNVPIKSLDGLSTHKELVIQCGSPVRILPHPIYNSNPSSPSNNTTPSKSDLLYDVPTNSQSIYAIPFTGKKNLPTMDALSLPYIDQSLEYTSTDNDREFDPRLSPENKSEKVHSLIQNPVTGIGVDRVNSLSRGRKLDFDDEINTKKHTDDSTEDNLGETAPKISKMASRESSASLTHPKRLLKAGNYPEAIGSTGNLKLCSSPSDQDSSKLKLEVSRPLSMSSIASSSSTSSSGVQNKGGVNSAYLASIESLDDHSDGEVMSATGSSGFVNSGLSGVSRLPGGTAVPEHDLEGSGLTQLQLLCAEIVNTETVYVEDLRQVIEGYLQEWRTVKMFKEEALHELFSNIEDIYHFNSTLCDDLKTCDLDAIAIARCFLNNAAGFSVYAPYCTAYPRTMTVLARLALDPQAARAFRERQDALGHPLPVASYLLKPVQRILRYPLLLKNMVKHCKSPETESAFSKMREIAQDTDDMKRKHEHRIRVQEIQSLLYGWNGPDLTTFGELCAEGEFRVFGARAVRHVFLFDKMLLITKHREDGQLSHKSDIMINNLMLVESITGAPLCFHVIPYNNPKGQLTLQANNARHKREWTLLLKSVILKDYPVIPNHAKQLVMELGQNRTDDDIIAEKSHNLISHASMRRQLTAPPEYLEKRKMDRERRKTRDMNAIRAPLNKKVSPKHTKVISSESHNDICQNCHDLCSDCELELSRSHSKNENDDTIEIVESLCKCQNLGRCAECDRSLHFIDSGSVDHLERKQSTCTKCSSGIGGSMESCRSQDYDTSFAAKENRPYRSSENVSCACSVSEIKNDSALDDNSSINSHSIKRTCLKCSKIKENIASTNNVSVIRKSRLKDIDGTKIDSGRSKSKEDIHRTKLPRIGTWRRKSEPGFQQNSNELLKKYDSRTKSTENVEENTCLRCRKVEFECRNCGVLIGKAKDDEIVDQKSIRNSRRRNTYKTNLANSNNESSAIEVKMYNTKNLPKKITKIKKNRAKASKVSPTKHTESSSAKFYADLSGDMSNENILHISESTDSVNTMNDSPKSDKKFTEISEIKVNKDLGIDEETYQRLIQKTDSFKKTELERDKCIQKLKVTTENDVTEQKDVTKVEEEVSESEKPLEQIISQLLMQNREFQKILKKHQMRNTAQRRHQRLLKSHSNPEKTIPLHVKEQNQKIKPKYGRQTSAVESVNPQLIDLGLTKRLTPTNELDSDDEHIYETLRIDTKSDTLKLDKSKPEISNSVENLETNLEQPETSRNSAHESDYVYLKFGADSCDIIDDGLYATPSKIMNIQRVKYDNINSETYATVESEIMENMYDNLVDLRLRVKEEKQSDVLNDTGYLAMSDQPNTPEIWISQQKEHFTTSRNRKSGSLPRSFQVVLNSKEDDELQGKVTSPTNKTYLNKDGKVLSIDRPFTIASDKSEISYDDVEQYMNDEGNILKFNKVVSSNRSSRSFSYENETAVDHLSRSTLELEEEIDKCYKTNIVNNNIDLNGSTNVLNDSNHLDTSFSTSMELLSLDRSVEIQEGNSSVHPEHKIYRPTSNLLSLKNVLNRFKNKTPTKSPSDNTDDSSVVDNSGSEKNSPKSNSSSPQKKSGLNPRSYSKNLMQRFKNIIGDEPIETNTKDFEDIKRSVVNEIKVVITSPEGTNSTSTIHTSANINKIQDILSKSVCETISSNEITDMDAFSKSCNNIHMPPAKIKTNFEKCRSVSVTNSSSKILSISHQNFNRLPIYMQGSKYLGARIAQSDYVDPQTLFTGIPKTDLENVNVLINKNAMRPDSLLSNSSHFTSSSDGCTQNEVITKQINVSENSYDESFYEKSFEQIENLIDEEVFRDSAVYSDQEDSETQKTTPRKIFPVKNKVLPTKLIECEEFKSQITKTIPPNLNVSVNRRSKLEKIVPIREIESAIENKSLKSESETPIDNIKPQINDKTDQISLITNNLSKSKLESRIEQKSLKNEIEKSVETDKNGSSIHSKTSTAKIVTPSKIAPPIAVKPTLKSPKAIKIRNEIINSNSSTKIINKTNFDDLKEFNESKNIDTVDTGNTTACINTTNSNVMETSTKPVHEKSSSSNIQIKRLSFERSSLDSTSRCTKSVSSVIETPNVENVIMKSVHERRMEIESFTKKITNTNENSVVNPNRRSNEFTQSLNSSNLSVKMPSYGKNFNEISRIENPSVKKIPVPNRTDLNLTTVKKTSIPQAHSSIKTHKYNAFNRNSIKDSDISVNVTGTNVKSTDEKIKSINTEIELTDSNVKLTDTNVKLTDTNDVTDVNVGRENEVNLSSLDSREGWVKQIVNKFQ